MPSWSCSFFTNSSTPCPRAHAFSCARTHPHACSYVRACAHAVRNTRVWRLHVSGRVHSEHTHTHTQTQICRNTQRHMQTHTRSNTFAFFPKSLERSSAILIVPTQVHTRVCANADYTRAPTYTLSHTVYTYKHAHTYKSYIIISGYVRELPHTQLLREYSCGTRAC